MSDSGGNSLFATTIFNPALLSKDALVRGFVAHQDLLERFLDDLRLNDGKNPAQHRLLIGQRGLGKTTLLRRIAFAVEDDPGLCRTWIPLVFPEEQYNVKNLGDFWLNCADALGDALERMGEQKEADLLDEKVASISADPRARSEQALACLVDECGRLHRGLLLLVDNIDIVLDRLDNQEEWEFRRIISERSCLYFIGASSRALEAVYDHGRAFYDYFQITDLKGLTDEETFTLLDHVAQQAGDSHVQQHLKEKPERIRALRVLTGGNPRTLMILYRNLARGTGGDVQGEVEQLLDTYTPLYKARFEELAAQAQKLVDAMAIHWDPITAGDLTEKLLPMNVNQVSAQLARLESLGVIEKVSWYGEKKAAFQLSERFFNVWYLMRSSRRVRRRLIWLVRFLEAWFGRDELNQQAERHLKRSPETIGSQQYAETALAFSQVVADPHLRRSLESAGLRAALSTDVREQIDFSDLPPELRDRKERMGRLLNLRQTVLKMRLEGVDTRQLWDALGGAPHLLLEEKATIVKNLPALPPEKLSALSAKLLRARETFDATFGGSLVQRLYEALGDGELTDSYDVEGAIAIAKDPRFKWLPDLAIRVRIRRDSNREELAEAELQRAETAISLLSQEPGFEAMGWSTKGQLLEERLGRFDEAEQAYRRAAELDPQSSFPLNLLGDLFKNRLGRYQEAEDSYRRALELDPNSWYSCYKLGFLLADHMGRYLGAESEFRRAIEINPQNGYSWYGLGNLFRDHLDRCAEAEDAYRNAISIGPESWFSWYGLGRLFADRLSRYSEAEDAYRHAIELSPESWYPWYWLGKLLTAHLKRFPEAEDAFRRAIDLDPRSSYPWYQLGVLFADHLGQSERAEQAFRRAIELDSQSPQPWDSLALLLETDVDRQAEALHCYCRAAALDPSDSGRRAEALRMAKAIRDTTVLAAALEELREMSRALSEPAEVRFVMAGLLIRGGSWAEGAKLLTELASDEKVWPEYWTFQAVVEAGRVEDVLLLLERTGADQRWRPLYEALQAVKAGTPEYLRRVAAEVRSTAEDILQVIFSGFAKEPGAVGMNDRR